MHGFAYVVGQRVRALKGGIVGIKQLLEDATGHDRSLPLSGRVMGPFSVPPGPSLQDPLRFFL